MCQSATETAVSTFDVERAKSILTAALFEENPRYSECTFTLVEPRTGARIIVTISWGRGVTVQINVEAPPRRPIINVEYRNIQSIDYRPGEGTINFNLAFFPGQAGGRWVRIANVGVVFSAVQ